MKTILTPVDFSSATRSVLDASIDLARGTGARVVLLHTVQPPVITTDYGLTADLLSETMSLTETGARKQLEHLQKILADKGIPAGSRLTYGFAAGNIVEHARKLRAAYIVLGSHGHTAVYDLLVGSTTHAVLKKAPCPVLVVPPAPKSKLRK
ncbi:MAG: universal stress protein [Opitutaceae bacterium]|jgi:nucleotide-binding universal stress UspA family protein